MPGPGRRAGGYSQSIRVFRLLDLLQGRRSPTSLDSLAEELEVSTRQVRRDLEALTECGHPTESIPTRDGRAGTRLVERRSRSIVLTHRERYALLAARRVFDVLAGTSLREDLDNIYRKVVAALPDDERDEIEAYGDRFLYVPGGGARSYVGREDVIDALLTGVMLRLRVRYTYVAANGATHDGVLEPCAMVLYRNTLYVVGPASRHGPPEPGREPRVWAVDRFQAATHQRGERFKPPADFHVDRYFRGAFGIFVGAEQHRVVVEFEPEARASVEGRVWHPSQEAEVLPDGGLRVAFHVGHLAEVTTWVLGWGSMVRVVEPPELVERVREELGAALALLPRPAA